MDISIKDRINMSECAIIVSQEMLQVIRAESVDEPLMSTWDLYAAKMASLAKRDLDGFRGKL